MFGYIFERDVFLIGTDEVAMKVSNMELDMEHNTVACHTVDYPVTNYTWRVNGKNVHEMYGYTDLMTLEDAREVRYLILLMVFRKEDLVGDVSCIASNDYGSHGMAMRINCKF